MNNANLEVGQIILVELEEYSVVGELTYISAGRTFMRLSNVRDVANKLRWGYQDYYSSEIRSIKIWVEKTKTPDLSVTTSVRDGSARAQSKPALNTKQLFIQYEYAALEKINMAVFIHQTDAQYHDAIKYLRQQREFGVFMESIEEGRHSMSPSLLSFVTFHRIFIFDIKWIKITKDLGDLLSSNHHRRVIHNGRMIKDVLQHRYGISLGRCFDIMVALIALRAAEEKGVKDPVLNSDYSIQYCAQKYFKLPPNFFAANIDFEKRPLPHESKQEAAKKVAFLLDLQDHIVHDIMLEKFYGSCEVYADSLAQESDFIDCLELIRNNGNEQSLRAISPFSLAMDVE